ncbi:hypothetical protein [Mucilaginibacter panaciglaebae]
MNLSISQRIMAFIAITLAIIIATNPTLKDFKNHLKDTSYDEITREHNYFIFSIYKDGADSTYIGFLGNFFRPYNKIDTFDKSYKLYTNLIKSGYPKDDLGQYSAFKDSVKSASYSWRLYDRLLKAGFTEVNLGTRYEFITTFSHK